jgi:hypothetical protein
MAKVFISYRHEDSNWAIDRLLGELELALGDCFFRDVDNIRPGKDFREAIREAVSQCEVMLVVIGPNWLNARDSDGRRRIDTSDDWLRFEIETALSRGITLIPVLLHPATLPVSAELPATLAGLSYRQAIVIHPGKDFTLGFQRLADTIRKYLTPNDPNTAPSQSNIDGTHPSQRNGLADRYKLRSWRVSLLACIILITSIILGVSVVHRSRDQLSLHDARETAADLYSTKTSQWFEDKFRILENALLDTAFRTSDAAQLKTALDESSIRNAFSGGVYALDADGVVQAQATPNHPEIGNLVGTNFSHREYFIESRRRNKTITTNAFLSANRREMIVVVASPRRDQNGNFIGILDGVLDVSTSDLSEIAQQVHDSGKERIELFLLDDAGIVLLRTRRWK